MTWHGSTGGPTHRSQQSAARGPLLAVAGLTLVVLAFFASYAIALGKPTAEHIPVAVAAPPAVIARLDTSPLLRVHPVSDLGTARTMVEDRAVYGALVLPVKGPTTVLVASGGGHEVATILMQFGQQLAHSRGTPLTTADVAPTSPNDPSGTVEFYWCSSSGSSCWAIPAPREPCLARCSTGSIPA